MSKKRKKKKQVEVISLYDRKRQKSKLLRSQNQDVETRLHELEADVLRLIDAVSHLDQCLEDQRRLTSKLVRILAASSSVASAPASQSENSTDP
jgi:chromatin segregation and condensation protein Rec8/ScpA/Scc1 (kleisin family)